MGTIKELRKARGWSPADLAAALGVSVATVYNWETDKHEPRASQLRDIARAFGVSMDSISIPGEAESGATRQTRSCTTPRPFDQQ